MKPLRGKISEAKYNRILKGVHVKIEVPIDYHFLVQFELDNSVVDGKIEVCVRELPWGYWKHPRTGKKYRIAVHSRRELIEVNSKRSNSKDWELIYLEWSLRCRSGWESSKPKQLPSWRMKKFDVLAGQYKTILKSFGVEYEWVCFPVETL